MKVISLLPAVVGIQLGLAVAAAVAAPGDTLSRVGGAVTKVDGKTITVTDRRSQSDVSFVVNAGTKYTVSSMGTTSDLKVGQKVMVMGQQNGNAVDARFIAVVPEGATNRMGGFGRRGGGQGGPGGFTPVQGTIASVSPSLTVTTEDKQTDTITTTDQTRVITSKAGSLSDITVGKFVNAEVDVSTPPVAKQVQIRPAFGGRGGFGGRRGGAGGGQ